MGLNSKVEIVRDYYSIEQLSDHWNVSKDDIIHLCLAKKIKLNAVSKWIYQKSNQTKYDCHIPLSKDDIARLNYSNDNISYYGELIIEFDFSVNSKHKINRGKGRKIYCAVLYFLRNGILSISKTESQIILESKKLTVTITLDDKHPVFDHFTISYHKKLNKLILATEPIKVEYYGMHAVIINSDDVKQYEIEHPNKAANIQNEIEADKPADNSTHVTPSINKIALSGLLKAPTKKDDWFLVIDDVTRHFYREHGKIPNETQAWSQLCHNPPAGYAVSTGKDKGEDCLFMPGFNPLSLSSFRKRWRGYTANKAQ